MENYLIAYNALYCLYLRVAVLRDKGFAGMALLTKGLTDDVFAKGYVLARNAN